jgi:sec-independent protein translocase protein TatC
LTLLRLLSPRFLLRHSRYAILAIVILAAIITPTPDVFNLMLFAIPMCLLYFVGVAAGLLLVMRREGRTVPWRSILWIALIVLLIVAASATAMVHFHIHFLSKWPYLTR